MLFMEPWNYIETQCHDREVLTFSFFLTFINDLAADLKSNVKLFADDTSLF